MKGPIIKAIMDIGSSRIKIILAKFVEMPSVKTPDDEISTEREFIIYSAGIIQKSILKNGVPINIPAASQAIGSALAMAEKNSGYKIDSVTINISDACIMGYNTTTEIEIDGRHVHQNDIVALVNKIKKNYEDKDKKKDEESDNDDEIQENDKVIHILAQEFKVDDQKGIYGPKGMKGDLLGLDAHVITAKKSAYDTLCRCVYETGVDIENVIYSGLASSYFATTKAERQNGVLLVDLGASVTDIVLWESGCPQLSLSVAMGGEKISSELAIALRTTRQNAENIKCRYGTVLYGSAKTDYIHIPSTGHLPGRNVASKKMIEVIRSHYQEFFTAITFIVNRVGKEMPACGVTFTGGATQIHGFKELAEQHFKCPVRVFLPDTRQGMPDLFQHDPSMTTALGLLHLHQIWFPDQIWEKEEKSDIISRFKNFLNRYLLTDEE